MLKSVIAIVIIITKRIAASTFLIFNIRLIMATMHMLTYTST